MRAFVQGALSSTKYILGVPTFKYISQGKITNYNTRGSVPMTLACTLNKVVMFPPFFNMIA